MSSGDSTTAVDGAGSGPDRDCVRSFATVTELPGGNASREQVAMAYARYGVARQLAVGKDVLEVACGSGMGLGFLARSARRVVGGDCDPALVDIARRHYGDRLEIRQLDAQQLPFPDGSFDLVLLLEAIYYLPNVEAFLAEAHRVLRPDGKLMICSANKEWSGFNPSPFSVRYYSLKELGELLNRTGFRPDLFVGFPVDYAGLASRFVNLVRMLAVRLGLIPKTMRSKEVLKRLFFGKLTSLPAELAEPPGDAPAFTPHPPYANVHEHKVLYAIGTVRPIEARPIRPPTALAI